LVALIIFLSPELPNGQIPNEDQYDNPPTDIPLQIIPGSTDPRIHGSTEWHNALWDNSLPIHCSLYQDPPILTGFKKLYFFDALRARQRLSIPICNFLVIPGPDSGVTILDIVRPDPGPEAQDGDIILLHYKMMLEDGT